MEAGFKLEVGSINKKGQMLIERTNLKGTNNQALYLMKCTRCLQIQKVNGCNAYSAKCKNFPACDFSIARNPLKLHVSRKAHFDYQKKDLINECTHVCRISTVKDCILTHNSPGTNRLNVEFHLHSKNVLQGKVRIVASGLKVDRVYLKLQEKKLWGEIFETNKTKIASALKTDADNLLFDPVPGVVRLMSNKKRLNCKFEIVGWQRV